MPPYDPSDDDFRYLCDNEDILRREDELDLGLSEDCFMPTSDYEHYLVFKRIPNDFSQKLWTLVRASDEVGHENALNEAIKSAPIERNYPVHFLTVNTTSQNVRQWKCGVTSEEIA